MSARSLRCPFAAFLLAWTSLVALPDGEAGAQTLDKSAQKCVNRSNRGLAKLVKVQGKHDATCIRKGATGKLATTIEVCLATDSRGRLARAQAANTKRVSKACAATPAFGIVDPTGLTANQIASVSDIAFLHSIFGADLDAVVVGKDADRAGHRCQTTVTRRAEKCLEAKLRAFNKCKKRALAGRKTPAVASAQELQDACLGTGLSPLPDPKGKVEKRCLDKLGKVADKKCGGQDTAALFPGCAGEDLATCVDRHATCGACLALNAVDGLARDCDAVDDQISNASCGVCTPGQQEPCYTGPPGTLGVGACSAGARTCDAAGSWGSCSGEVLPSLEICTGLDDDCDGLVDEGCP